MHQTRISAIETRALEAWYNPAVEVMVFFLAAMLIISGILLGFIINGIYPDSMKSGWAIGWECSYGSCLKDVKGPYPKIKFYRLRPGTQPFPTSH
jgi:hypothetical protein